MAGEHGQRAESDVQADTQVAASRAKGGVEQPEHPDQHSTTGTTPSGTFVGRVAGTDTGYEGDTGAERRAAATGGSGDDRT